MGSDCMSSRSLLIFLLYKKTNPGLYWTRICSCLHLYSLFLIGHKRHSSRTENRARTLRIQCNQNEFTAISTIILSYSPELYI